MRRAPLTLWYVLGDEVAAVAGHPRLAALLSQEEEVRAARFHFPADRDRFVTGRALARVLLSTTDGTPAAAWRLEVDARGRPGVADRGPGTPAFSITHTRGLVACALALRGEVGLDAECSLREHDFDALARRYFAREEVDHLERFEGAERRRAFYVVWTLKEAFLKARGEGITVPLDRFRFDPADSPPGFSCHPDHEPDPSAWRFRSWWPTPEHAMALAVRGAGEPGDAEVRSVAASDLLGALGGGPGD